MHDRFRLALPAVNVILISATPAQRISARHGAWRCSRDGALTTPEFLLSCATLDGQALALDSRGEIVPLRHNQPTLAQRAAVGDWPAEFLEWRARREQVGKAIA
ncbi:MAG: hypothetical protein KGN16_05990 [Burkholderiales bacterium]|nr:hypothetical protein [Burkholderiales bacterium]